MGFEVLRLSPKRWVIIVGGSIHTKPFGNEDACRKVCDYLNCPASVVPHVDHTWLGLMRATAQEYRLHDNDVPNRSD